MEKAKIYSMVHLNGDVLCAFDMVTTGKEVDRHDIVEMCCLIYDYEIKPNPNILPFHVQFKASRFNGNMHETNLPSTRICDATLKGFDKSDLADYFEKWFDELNLRDNKKLALLTHNWAEKYYFLVDWLGTENYKHFFDHRVRDLQASALFINDRSYLARYKIPYPKTKVTYLASQLNIECNVEKKRD